MPDPTDPTLVTALWAAAAAWAAAWAVPVLVTAAGGGRYANGGYDDPAALEPDGTDPGYAGLFAALTARGYEPIGPGWMRLTFHVRAWVYGSTVRAFRHRAAGRFVFLHHEPPAPGWHQIMFATCWADGALDLTAGGQVEAVADAGAFTATTLPTDDLAALEGRHAAREKEREARGHRRDPDLGIETLLAATERHKWASTLGPGVAMARAELAGAVVPLAGLTAVPVLIVGFDHAAGPLTALGVQAFFAVILAAKRAALRRVARDRAAAWHDAGW